MKRIIPTLIIVFFYLVSFSQNYDSERYRKAIFDNVTITENVSIFPTILGKRIEIEVENNYKPNENWEGIIYSLNENLVENIEINNNLISTQKLNQGICFLELIIGNKKGIYKFIIQ